MEKSALGCHDMKLYDDIMLALQDASQEHILSMVVMLNEKFRENVPAWEGFAGYSDLIPIYFQRLFALRFDDLKMHERVSFLVFFIHAFQSLENDAISKQVLRLVQLPLWHSLSPGRLQVWFCRPPARLPLQLCHFVLTFQGIATLT